MTAPVMTAVSLPAPSRTAAERHNRLEVIEMLRGVAALSVAWFHFTNGGPLVGDGWLKTSGGFGWLGVDVFFVVSGFVIPYSLFRGGYRFPAHTGRFIAKRLVRLDPPYLTALALTIALLYLSAAFPGFRGEEPRLEIVPLLLHLGYLNAFFGYPWLLPVLWTLAIEFQYYLLMALIFPLVSYRSAPVRYGAMAVLCGLSLIVPDEALVFRYLGLFVLGILTFDRHRGVTATPTYLMLLVPAAAVTAAALSPEQAAAGLIAALTMAFVRMRRAALPAFLGAISYSLYLLHVPIGGRVINLGARHAEGPAAVIGVLAAAVIVSAAAAVVMYLAVERPARRWSASIGYGSEGNRRATPARLTENDLGV